MAFFAGKTKAMKVHVFFLKVNDSRDFISIAMLFFLTSFAGKARCKLFTIKARVVPFVTLWKVDRPWIFVYQIF